MKQLRLIILILLLAITGSSFANDELKVANIILIRGERTTLSLELTNETTMIAFEFWMRLPDGIHITKDEDGDFVVIKNNMRLNKHELLVTQDDKGLYHFLCYSNPIRAIKDNDGELLSIELTCDSAVNNGSYQTTIENIIFSDGNRVRHDLSDCTFQTKVRTSILGDVNQDDKVTIADVTAIVNIILGKDDELRPVYDHKAANVNQDNAVTIADVTALVNLILK